MQDYIKSINSITNIKSITMKLYVCFLSIILFCIPFRGHYQENKNIKYDLNGNIKYIKFDEELESSLSSVTVTSSTDFFDKILGVNDPNLFLLKNRTERKDGSYYEGYRQYYDTIEVEGGIYILHFRAGKIEAANGHLVNISKINITPCLTPEQACTYYLKYLGSTESNMPKFYHRLIISEFEDITDKDTIYSTRLCHTIQLLNSTFGCNEVGYIDAQTGEILKTEKDFNFYSNATFDTTMYSNYRNTRTEYYSGNFILKDLSHDTAIHTWDLNNDDYTNYSNRVDFTDNDNMWTTYEHYDDYDMVAEDIHWALELNYGYHYDNFNGFSSFDNNDTDIDAYVHAILSGNNPKDNAAYVKFENNYQALFFGDGQLTYKPLGSLDVVSHEYAHGITANNTGLSNDEGVEQSMKEGFSDIWGVVIEDAAPYNANDTDKECWKIGEEIINVAYYDCMRNVEDPESASAKIQMADTYGDYYYTNGNFYAKSGVMSHWFYLLAEGGNGTNDNNDNYIVYGLGIEDAAKIVFEGQTGHFANVDNYSEAREAMIDASDEIFSDLESMQVANAWYAVGVGSEPEQIYITGESTICPYGDTYEIDGIENLPPNYSISWSSSNNITTTVTDYGEVFAAPSSSSPGWLFATITTQYSSITLDTFYINIESSPWLYNIAPEYGNYYGYEGNSYSFHAWPEYYSNYTFSIYPPYAYINWVQGALVNIYFPYPDIPFTISAYANNGTCNSNIVSMQFYVYGMDFLLSPNPASDEVTITISVDKSDTSVDLSKADQVYDVSILDIKGNLKSRKEYFGEKFSIPVQNLKDGEYLIRIDNGKSTATKQLIIKH